MWVWWVTYSYWAFIGTVSIGSISERKNLRVVGSKNVPHYLCTLFEHDDHESSHQVASIGLLVKFIRAEVEYFSVFVEGILYQRKINHLVWWVGRSQNMLWTNMYCELTDSSLMSSLTYLWVFAMFNGPKSLWNGSY